MAAQYSSSQWPQASIAFKGNLSINGYPAGPKDSYMTLGGFMDPNDSNNANVTVAAFGNMVSAVTSTGDQWVLGQPAGGYVPRGVLMVDQSIMYNEPMKSGGYALGLPATVITRGFFRLSSWTANGSGSLATPYLSAVPIVNTASGYIEFAPSGTTTAPVGFTLAKDLAGNNIFRLVDLDPLMGSTSVGGILMYIQAY
jgi:hypothetical protein